MGRSASVGVEVFADLRADVGEAPHWDERSKTLLFVDLTGGVVFRYDQYGAELTSFSVGQEVGAVVPRRGGGLVLAVRDGIAVATESGEGFELTVPVERDTPGNRMNDAKCDPVAGSSPGRRRLISRPMPRRFTGLSRTGRSSG